MKNHFYFWEKIKEYDVRVLNEREVRAWAGILFFFAMIAFLNAFLIGNFYPIKLFIIVFLIDFIIRVLINPKYSPSLILWRLAVSNQKPEYSWAPQKKFARAIWLILAIIMFFSVVLNNTIWPINVIICVICITLLFLETSFGICVGCKVYNRFNKQKAQLCPWWACEIVKKQPIQKTNRTQILIVVLLIFIIFSIHLSNWINPEIKQNKNINQVSDRSWWCEVWCFFK